MTDKSPEQQAREQAELEAREAILRDYALVFSSVEGQRVLRHIKATSYCYQTTAVVGDAYGTHFREGMRIGALNIEERAEKGRYLDALAKSRRVIPSVPHDTKEPA